MFSEMILGWSLDDNGPDCNDNRYMDANQDFVLYSSNDYNVNDERIGVTILWLDNNLFMIYRYITNSIIIDHSDKSMINGW